MRALVLNRYKEELLEVEVEEPAVGAHDLLVRVEAAGLNQLDEKVRLGEFRQILPLRLPTALGHDIAGTVLRVGAAVRDFAPGDEVFARLPDGRIGGFAERIAVADSDVALRPRSISMTEAGSLPLAALTA